jgi:hypothetical protein
LNGYETWSHTLREEHKLKIVCKECRKEDTQIKERRKLEEEA